MGRRGIIVASLAALCLAGAADAFVGAPLAPAARAAPSALRMVVTEDSSGALNKFVIKKENAEDGTKQIVEVYPYGACVTSFKSGLMSEADEELHDYLFVRPDAKMDGSKPISGGLPLCWPQFGPGEIQQHGFARNMMWEVAEIGEDEITLRLNANDETKSIWGYEFQLIHHTKIEKDGSLRVGISIENKGDRPFGFQFAFHSYYNVGDVAQMNVEGPFENARYLDKLEDPPTRKTHYGSRYVVDKAWDAIFYELSGKLAINDRASRKRLLINNLVPPQRDGFTDTVVWNPWGDEGMGYKNFVCVESGRVTSTTVRPRDIWDGVMVLTPQDYEKYNQ